MANLRGIVQGNRGPASRLGSRELSVEAQSWQGKVTVRVYRDEAGTDVAHVALDRHEGAGVRRTLYHGPIGGEE